LVEFGSQGKSASPQVDPPDDEPTNESQKGLVRRAQLTHTISMPNYN